MIVERISAFCRDGEGGNPAGVMMTDMLPEAVEMQRIAAEVGYSETAFAAPHEDGFRVRYFAPAMEVPFCGHATIALGTALGASRGAGTYALQLNDARISVEADEAAGIWSAALTSLSTAHRPPDPDLVEGANAVFGLAAGDLAGGAEMVQASAGADMLLIPIASRERLSRLDYEMEAGAAILNAHGIIGAYMYVANGPGRYDVRMPFPTGGVFEDPATGAAAAAFAGWLRDTSQWSDQIEIIQGEDMGQPSRLIAHAGAQIGSPVRVEGATRRLS